MEFKLLMDYWSCSDHDNDLKKSRLKVDSYTPQIKRKNLASIRENDKFNTLVVALVCERL